MKIIDWFVTTYLSDRYVPREDFDHVQNREFPVVQREMSSLRAERDLLLRENQKLICEGLHSHGFLPRFADARGTVDFELRVYEIREQFLTRVCVDLGDDEVRHVMHEPCGSERIFEHLAKMLAEHIKRNLCRRFGVAQRRERAVR